MKEVIMATTIRRAFVITAVAVGTLVAPRAGAQETLQHVKDLYASAAYEDALGVLARIQNPAQRLEIERYRVFCLIALDRTAEAERAIQGILAEDPLYTPDEAPPSIVGLFKRVKREAAPQLARSLYTDGKAAMDQNEQDEAVRKFEQLLQLTDDPAVRDETLVSELRLLAAGFLDLARASARAKTAPTNDPEPNPAPVTPVVVTPPIPIRQELPRWVPYDAATKQAEFKGAIKVTISAEGKVENAEIVTPTDRQYDRELLNAARSWEYQPATRNGIAVPSEKIVSVFLRPR
jgi:TonB family protein